MQIKTENIFQVIEMDASIPRVYKLLTDEEQIENFTKNASQFSTEPGGKFDVCGNMQFGYNLKLVKNKHIIQAWTHQNIPNQQFSIVNIELTQNEEGKTLINFNQIGVPEDCAGWLTSYWRTNFWTPLQKFVKENSTEKTKSKVSA